MASIIHTAAQRLNTDTAGLTYVPETPPGAPVSATVSEVGAKLLHGTSEGLGFLTGGTHPESIGSVANLNTNEVQATDSRPGKMGGLVPRVTGTVAPGPAGAAASARSTWAKLRKGLGI